MITNSDLAIPIAPFVDRLLKANKGGAFRLKRINQVHKKFGSKGLAREDQKVNISRAIASANGRAYLEGSTAKKIGFHFGDILATCHHSQTLSHKDVRELHRHFTFFIDRSSTSEESSHLLWAVITLHCRLIEDLPTDLVNVRYGNQYRQVDKVKILELENFEVVFKNIIDFQFENTSKNFNLLYKRVDMAVIFYLATATDFDPSFDSDPFFRRMANPRRSKQMSLEGFQGASCLSPFLYISSDAPVPRERKTTGPLCVNQFVPAELLRITFAHGLRETSQRLDCSN